MHCTAVSAFIAILCTQPLSVYQLSYRITLMLVLYVADVQCKYWMTNVKLTFLCNSHQCRLTLERLCSYRGRKKQFKATYLSWTSWLKKKDVSIAWKQTSDIKLAIKTVQPTLCPTTLWLTVCTVLSAGRSTSDFSAPIISLLHMTSHSASIMSMTECSVCGKKTHPHSGQPLTLWLSSSVRWGGTSWSD